MIQLHPCARVDSLDTEDLCPGQDLDPLLAGNTGSDGSSVLLRVHEEEFEVTEVVDEEFFVAGRDEVSGLLVGSVTDLGHGCLSLEPSSDLSMLVTISCGADNLGDHDSRSLFSVLDPPCNATRPPLSYRCSAKLRPASRIQRSISYIPD